MSENQADYTGNATDVRPPMDAKKPILIGVAGGTASGKSSVCSKIVERLDTRTNAKHQTIATVSMDLFYKDLSDEEVKFAKVGEYNFDHPKSFDFRKMYETLQSILRREHVEIHEYDARNFKRLDTKVTVPSDVDIVLVEGILVFYNKDVRDLFHMKLFVDSDADIRLSRRVLRDTNERGRDLNHVLSQYTKFVKPAFEDFCLPTKKYADVILPRGADNKVGIDVIVQNLEDCCSGGIRRHRSISRTSSESGTVSRPH